MSLGFQKRYGDMTVGNLTLQAIKDGNKPDIWKMAKLFAPELTLIPIVKYWRIDINRDDFGISFDGLYFGNFEISHNSNNTADSDNRYCRSHAYIYHNDQIAIESKINHHGDDVMVWGSNSFKHQGFATGMGLYADGQTRPYHNLSVSFVGFKLGELAPLTYLSDVEFVYAYDASQVGHVIPSGAGTIPRDSTPWLLLPQSDDNRNYRVYMDGILRFFIGDIPAGSIPNNADLSSTYFPLVHMNIAPINSFSIISCTEKVAKFYQVELFNLTPSEPGFHSRVCEMGMKKGIDLNEPSVQKFTTYPSEFGEDGLFDEIMMFDETLILRKEVYFEKSNHPSKPSLLMKRNGETVIFNEVEVMDGVPAWVWYFDYTIDEFSSSIFTIHLVGG